MIPSAPTPLYLSIHFRLLGFVDLSNTSIKERLVVVPLHQLIFMSELDLQIPSAFDPFAETSTEDSGAGSKEYIHIRVQQRNDRKSLTTVPGLRKDYSYNKILKDLKKEFCCNGTLFQCGRHTEEGKYQDSWILSSAIGYSTQIVQVIVNAYQVLEYVVLFV
ncbi:uncharacterized protein [Rutidosis leptorrhynchoides]|uniref:uncharacterized protein n=1 Tax=Rutidosis leptorrhynchoides TaxID=125765 RepID=UPI003A99F13F